MNASGGFCVQWGSQQRPHIILCILLYIVTRVGWGEEWANKPIIQALILRPDDLWEPISQGRGVSHKKLSHNQLLIVRVVSTDVMSLSARMFLCFLEFHHSLRFFPPESLLLGHLYRESLVEKHKEMMVFLYGFYCFGLNFFTLFLCPGKVHIFPARQIKPSGIGTAQQTSLIPQ